MSLDFLADDTSAQPSQGTGVPWKVLIVDDVKDVHDTTRLALQQLTFESRGLQFLHAYSAEEARGLFEEHADIAVALVDVVMETEDAGLVLVQWLRETHGNNLVRIILRTGQPGYAPEAEVIDRYEIDDYKDKTELSHTKLTTALICAFRGYRQLEALERNRHGLERLINSLKTLYSRQALDEFANAILQQLSALLDVELDGMVCVVDQSRGSQQSLNRVLAAGGALESYTGRLIDELPDQECADLIRRCIEQGETLWERTGMALALITGAGTQGAVFLKAPPERIAEDDANQLLRLFTMNASVAYDNATLFEEVHTLAFTDPATGLPSFSAFCKSFETARDEERPLMLGLFDVYRSREIAHGLGEERTERMMQKIGERLATELEEVITVARRESDEFAILFELDADLDPHELIARIDEIFHEPIELDDASLMVRGRLGLARQGIDGDDPRELARYAAIALNELRRQGHGRAKLFQPELQAIASERLRLASMLTRTSGETETRMVFHPVVDTQSGVTTAAEALIRFIGPDGTPLRTDKMIDAAEANGMIVEIGAWVLREAMRQHVMVMDSGSPHRLNVNLSPAQIHTPRIYVDIEKGLSESGLDPALLNIEVTENLFLDNDDETLALLRWLRERGARIYIDDFGTGYSSLSYLGKLPVDGLKIDRSFVMNMDEDTEAAAVVGSVIAIGAKLGMDVVAEGVETEEQRRLLTDLGANKLQGFLFTKPCPAEELRQFLGGRQL
ncbi:GGDEF/EAL domain-containing response regulator [Halomonas halmophila]|uniref:Diguanylate cyclase n=1 Tax=Halomonas halmophila TaxID=252 RepID=A0A4Y4EUH3_9GAMM|nr:EAL domain-containing protein [Halomonas halmophila]GED21562.1 diguanylate cyclase [Halomonas halmophila]